MATALKPAAQTVNFHFQEDLTRGKELVSPPQAESPAVAQQDTALPLFDMFQDVVAKNNDALNAQAKSQEAAQKHIAEQQQTITALLAEVATLKKQVSTLESSGQKATLTHQAEMQSQSNLHAAATQRLQAQVAQLQAQNPAQLQQLQSVKTVIEKALKQLVDHQLPEPIPSSFFNPEQIACWRYSAGYSDSQIVDMGCHYYFSAERLITLKKGIDQSQGDLKAAIERLTTLETQMKP